jgi:hypothetical protein
LRSFPCRGLLGFRFPRQTRSHSSQASYLGRFSCRRFSFLDEFEVFIQQAIAMVTNGDVLGQNHDHLWWMGTGFLFFSWYQIDLRNCSLFNVQWFRQKSGSDSAVRSEFVITGMIFHQSRVKSELLHKYIE